MRGHRPAEQPRHEDGTEQCGSRNEEEDGEDEFGDADWHCIVSSATGIAASFGVTDAPSMKSAKSPDIAHPTFGASLLKVPSRARSLVMAVPRCCI
jgi:hypothetical protein